MTQITMYATEWKKVAHADRDRLTEAEWARLAQLVFSADEFRQSREGSRLESPTLKRLVSNLRYTQG